MKNFTFSAKRQPIKYCILFFLILSFGNAYGLSFKLNYSTYTLDNITNNDVSIEGYLIDPEIDVVGNGISIANGDTTPSLTDQTNYGTHSIGTPVTKTFTINNNGSTNLTISSISLSNTVDFSITGTPFSSPVATLSGTTFQITFNSLSETTQSSTVTIVNDDSDEGNYQFTIEATAKQSFFDSDNDGIYDNVDIDDDNDGILDTYEENSCKNSSVSTTVNYKFLNETFGTGDRTTINTNYDAITTYCYEDGTSGVDTIECPDLSSVDLNDGQYTVYYKACNGDGINDTPIDEVASWADDFWFTGEDHTPDDINGRMAMFNASYDPGLFYTANISGALPSIPITYSFWVINLDRTDADDIENRLRPNILVEFRDVNDNLLASITTGDIAPTTAGNNAGDWYNFSADLTFNVDEFNVYFINNEIGGLGNDLALDDIVISQTLCDTDSDGIADVFDLDSDNDGIPDVVEIGLGQYSGGTATLLTGGTWVDANANGMHDAAEGFIPLDSDGDGTPNFLDLDSDNDTLFDVDESGAGNTADPFFQNGDGDIDGDGVGDGTDTDFVRETDVDSNGILEYYADGILDIYDYFNGDTVTTAYGNQNQGTGYTYYVLDTDLDGTPDYLDVQSDGSTYDISHTLYANLDSDNNGSIDGTVDSEGDGIIDLFDSDDSSFGSPRDLNLKLVLSFDGRNDYVQDAELLSGLSNVSVMGWIKIDPSFSGRSIILGQNNIEIELQDNSEPRIYGRVNGTTITNNPATHPIVKNQWYHISVVYDGTNDIMKLYLNGEEIANSNGVGSTLNTNTYGFTIGKASNPSDTDSYYKGEIDEIRIFNKSLSDDELHKIVYQEIQDNGLIRGTVIPKDVSSLLWSDLIKYYRLDNYNGNIADDLTTPDEDVLTGAKIYNAKVISIQTAPMPFITQQSGNLPTAVDIPANGVNGQDAATYDWSIVQVKHNNITYNNRQAHLGLIVDEFDALSNPIEFSVQNDSELNISWYLKLDGKIDLEGESQLVQGIDSELDASSKGIIEQDQQGTKDLFTYNYWGSPVGSSNPSTNNNNYTIPDVLRDGSNPAAVVPINFITNSYNGTNGTPIGIADYWIWKYSNNTNSYYNWQHVRSTGTMLVGEGFTMKGVSNTSNNLTLQQNYVFKGKPNNGDITLPIIADNEYLVGNPYASAIDANQFIVDNAATIQGNGATNGTLYFWEHWGGGTHNTSGYKGGYATYNLSGAIPTAILGTNTLGSGGSPTKLPGRYIPVGQGFFVSGENTGNIIFNNGQRVFEKESTNSIFIRSSNENSTSNFTEPDDRMKIRLGFNSVSNLHRQILVTVDPNATSGVDFGYDAENIDSQVDDMYWMINNEKYLIQGTDTIEAQTILPLGLHAATNGINTFTIDALENVPNTLDIYIYDKVTLIYHNIRQSDFSIDLQAGEYLQRFELRFADANLLSTEESTIENTGMQFYFANDSESIIINNPELHKIDSVELYNILGQSIKKFDKIKNQEYTEIKTNNLSTGNYVIEVRTKTGKISKKVLID